MRIKIQHILYVCVATSICLWPALILMQQTLEHLYIDHTYLLDIGFWIGLSTAFNPLLIEPSTLNGGYSYFNTHFSPIFIFLQIIFRVIQGNNPPLFFACWFCLLGITPIVASITTTLCQSIVLSRQRIFQKIAILIAAAISTYAYVSSNTWQESFVDYLHPEIIGIQLIGAGWLMLAFNEINFGNQLRSKRFLTSAQALLGVASILIGACFHELIAAIAIALLISIRFCRKNSVQFQNFWSIKEPIIAIAICLGGWLSLKSAGFFPGSGRFDSSLTRIYLGSPAFEHVNPESYLSNIKELISQNQLLILFLVASLVISIACSRKVFRLILLSSVPLLGYILLSPFAIHKNAATLTSHYNYPLSLSFFFLLLTMSQLLESRQINYAKTSMPYIVATALLILLIMTPFDKLRISQQEVKVFKPGTQNNLETYQQLERKSLAYAKQFNLLNSIRDLWAISVKSNLEINTLRTKGQMQFSSLQTTKESSTREKGQQTVVLVDHSFSALYPNLIGHCNLITPNKERCLEEIIASSRHTNLAFLTMQPEDSLDIKLVQHYLTLLNLKERITINVGQYLNQNYQITLLSRQPISSSFFSPN